jgi:hypothetical protein
MIYRAPYSENEPDESTHMPSDEELAAERKAVLDRYSELTKEILFEKGIVGMIQGEVFVFNDSLGFQVCILDSQNEIPSQIVMFVCPFFNKFPPIQLEAEDFDYEYSGYNEYSFSAQHHEGLVNPVTQHFVGQFNVRGNITTMQETR